jgi:methylglyoxal synthase
MNVGMIAHDAKKKLMQNFCIAYRGILSKNTLYATATTGRLIEEATNLSVHKFLLRKTQTSTSLIGGSSTKNHPRQDITPAVADL